MCVSFPCRFCNSLVYYGLGLNAGSLPGNVYVTTFFYGISEIPANLFGIYLMNTIGRKFTIAFACLFGSACSFICVALIIFEGEWEKLGSVADTKLVAMFSVFPSIFRIGLGHYTQAAILKSGVVNQQFETHAYQQLIRTHNPPILCQILNSSGTSMDHGVRGTG